MFITAAPTDDHIRHAVMAALENSEMAARLRLRDTVPNDLHQLIRDDEDELAALAADLGNKEISRVEWKAARAPIMARLEAARKRLERSSQTSVLDGFIGTMEEMQQRWENSNTSQRRAVVVAAVEKVKVHPGTPGGRFNPNRLKPFWRG
jgi:hypothetical protein